MSAGRDDEEKKRLIESLEGSLERNCSVINYWNKVVAEDTEKFMENAKKLKKKEALIRMNEIKKSCYVILATLEDIKRIFYDYYDLRRGKL